MLFYALSTLALRLVIWDAGCHIVHYNLCRTCSAYGIMIPVCVCVCEKKTLLQRRTLGQTGFQSTKSGAEEQFLLKDCKARDRVEGVFVHEHRRDTLCHNSRLGFNHQRGGVRSKLKRYRTDRNRNIYVAVIQHGSWAPYNYRVVIILTIVIIAISERCPGLGRGAGVHARIYYTIL